MILQRSAVATVRGNQSVVFEFFFAIELKWIFIPLQLDNESNDGRIDEFANVKSAINSSRQINSGDAKLGVELNVIFFFVVEDDVLVMENPACKILEIYKKKLLVKSLIYNDFIAVIPPYLKHLQAKNNNSCIVVINAALNGRTRALVDSVEGMAGVRVACFAFDAYQKYPVSLKDSIKRQINPNNLGDLSAFGM